MSQKQRQQWFHEVEERSRSGDWDATDCECVCMRVCTYHMYMCTYHMYTCTYLVLLLLPP